MAKTDSKFVKEILDRLESSSNDAKAKEIVRALGRRICQRPGACRFQTRDRSNANLITAVEENEQQHPRQARAAMFLKQ